MCIVDEASAYRDRGTKRHKLARKIKPNAAAIAIGLAAFVSVGLLHMPMLLAILVLGPLSIGLVWWQRR